MASHEVRGMCPELSFCVFELLVFRENVWRYGLFGTDGTFDFAPVDAVVLGNVGAALGLAVVLVLAAGHLPGSSRRGRD